MALLKKIKASTLMETLVATVLIVVVFMISSMILNNLFSNSIKNNTQDIDAYLNELEYLYENKKIKIPYQDEFKDWLIVIERDRENQPIILMEALNSNINKSITKTIHEN
jgi:predicted PurR-regulated permease PerM